MARRAYSWLFGAFAAIAILMAAARASVSQVLLSGMTPVSMGVAVGLLGNLWATTLLRTLLFGISSRDPVIYAAVVIGVIGVGLLANFVPARRAAAVDPIRALHFD